MVIWDFLTPTVNSGILSVALASSNLVWISVTSNKNSCCSPPLKPGKHCTSNESVVWFTTEQLVGGSGGPIPKNVYKNGQ